MKTKEEIQAGCDHLVGYVGTPFSTPRPLTIREAKCTANLTEFGNYPFCCKCGLNGDAWGKIIYYAINLVAEKSCSYKLGPSRRKRSPNEFGAGLPLYGDDGRLISRSQETTLTV